MKKAIATVALAAGLASLTACGPGGGYTTVANQNYCVNEQSGQVMPPQYCQVGGMYYNPMLYDYWVGPTYGHRYGVGTVIQHNYFVSGRQVKPADTSARKAAGLPVSGSVSNGAKSSTTTRTPNVSTPAKPQNGPSRTGVSGSTSRSTSGSTSRSTFGSSGSTSRSSSTFGSSGSSSRSSSSFGSSGGRK